MLAIFFDQLYGTSVDFCRRTPSDWVAPSATFMETAVPCFYHESTHSALHHDFGGDSGEDGLTVVDVVRSLCKQVGWLDVCRFSSYYYN